MSANDKKDAPANSDNGLDELLDDALKDFEKTDQTPQSSNATAPALGADLEDAFLSAQANAFKEQMGQLFGEVEEAEQMSNQLMAGFKKMAEATSIALQGETKSSDEEVKKYADSISDALKGINEASDNLQGGLSEADVAKLFSGLGLDEGAETDENPFVPFMEGMMQSLLSPEILLPGLKDLLERYPKYLEENGDKISPEDKERYEKQLDLYKVICNRLESEKPDDTPKEKRANNRIVMEDMRKLQEYGQPPAELVDVMELPSLNTAAPPSNSQCPMM